MPRMSDAEIRLRLNSLRGWQLKDKEITKDLKFSSFKDTMIFVNKVAELAETENHHPDIQINYDRVILSLISHDVNSLTSRDFNFAEKIDALQG